MRLDARRPLKDLHAQWATCSACDLGQRRQMAGGAFVPGEGAPRGIMLIGDGPGKTDESHGRPFMGDSGMLLRSILNELHVDERACYFTHIVPCRSCKQRTDAAGEPQFRKIKGILTPMLQDQSPLSPQVDACISRLYEEIYIVDPLVIVTFGAVTATALLRRPVSILKEAGHEQHALIPGVSQVPALTDGGVWIRKQKKELVMPTKRNEVRYLCIPTLHLGYVAMAADDMAENSPMKQLMRHLKSAWDTYSRLTQFMGLAPVVEDNEAWHETDTEEEEDSDQ